MQTSPCIAYFSMEVGLDSAIPTYAGGLGVLAGDTLRSAADHGIPMVGISLLARKGYFHQKLDETGWQTEEPVEWTIDNCLEEMDRQVQVTIENRTVTLRAWKYEIQGVDTHTIPVYLLDTDINSNTDMDRTLTHNLYGGDAYYRLCQEVVLGIGGIRMLRALGYSNISRYHMNEGHASLLVLELLAEHAQQQGATHISQENISAIKSLCVFTTHTPVPSGHDKFPLDLVYRILGTRGPFHDQEDIFCCEGELNLTYLALENSHFINGVAKRHGEISRQLFSRFHIDSITNGIHAATWSSPSMQKLFDRHIPDWRRDNAGLRYAISIPKLEIWEAHQVAKRMLLEHVNHVTNTEMARDILTIGFARRATQYKRADLLFHDTERLRGIAKKQAGLQIIFAGKAHPHDIAGKEIIQHIHRMRDILKNDVNIVYLPEYDVALAKLMTAGCDLWLNTPQPPMEASGTSGMKAAVNGVPSLSILDGWWLEGCIEGVTGWAIGERTESSASSRSMSQDADALYDKLEHNILPMYYQDRDAFIEIMRSAVAINGSFFNTERMVNQYVTKAYFI